jgi:DNA-binding MarR family transcriptional regulator
MRPSVRACSNRACLAVELRRLAQGLTEIATDTKGARAISGAETDTLLVKRRRSRRAARALTRAFERQLRPLGIRATQFSILTNPLLRGPVTIGELAEFLGVDRTTLTRNLALVEGEGWVEIRPGNDARSRVVAATRKGRAAVTAALPAWRKALRR